MVRATSSNVLRRITTLLIISCLLTVGLCVNTAAALPGSGTQEDPWRIESLADFDEFAGDANYWDDYTRLETDVNLAGRTYSTAVIAPDTDNANYWFDGTPFNGVFDGNDRKIINLTIDDGGAGNCFLGLFGYIGYIGEDGEVKNLGLEGVSISGDSSYYVGGLVGHNGSSFGMMNLYPGYIYNSYSSGNVQGRGYVGGLVGINSVGSISDCYSIASVSGDSPVGGLVGHNEVGRITDCYSTGDVRGDYGGGLVGVNGSCGGAHVRTPIISNCYSTGEVSGSDFVAGLVGYNCGNIEGSFWDVETSGEPNMCGEQGEYATGCDPNCGKTTAEMQTRSTFTDAAWDFVEIWLINEGATYPVLRQEIRSDLNGIGGVDFADFAVFADHWLQGTPD